MWVTLQIWSTSTVILPNSFKLGILSQSSCENGSTNSKNKNIILTGSDFSSQLFFIFLYITNTQINYFSGLDTDVLISRFQLRKPHPHNSRGNVNWQWEKILSVRNGIYNWMEFWFASWRCAAFRWLSIVLQCYISKLFFIHFIKVYEVCQGTMFKINI